MLPAEGLVGVEELLDVPAFEILAGQGSASLMQKVGTRGEIVRDSDQYSPNSRIASHMAM
jgi:hypothetical protein